MKFYYLADNNTYYAKLSEASAAARERAKFSYTDIEVEQVDIDTDKDSVLRRLNNDGGTPTSTDEPTVVYVTRGRMKGKAR